MLEKLEARSLMSVVVSSVDRLVFSDVVPNAAASAAQTVTLANNGSAAVTLTGLTLSGAAPTRFTTDFTPATLQPGDSKAVAVRFTASVNGPTGAILTINTDEAVAPTVPVTLRGLGTRGTGGSNEPSLQWILDTFQIPVRTGDTTPAESTLTFPPASPNDEVVLPLLVKAGDGPVTITPIAAYTDVADPGAILGYYDPSTLAKTQLFTIPSADVQALNPQAVGSTTFDPGTSTFGIYTQWPLYPGRTAYTQDALNTWEPNAARRREFRFYPLKNPDGTIVPDAYVVGNEEAANHDMQDMVFIVRNVKAPAAVPPTGTLPADPTGATASVTSTTQVVLRWTDVATNETGYKVERSTDGVNFTQVAVPAANATSYTATGLTPGATYTFRVRAANTTGDSGFATAGAVAMPVSSAVPSPWAGRDIGSVGLAGTQSYDAASAAFTVTGAGLGLAGSDTDSFHFLSRASTTTDSVTARVASFGAGTGGQAGVMIRSSTNANARHVTVLVSRDGVVTFSYRAVSSTPTTVTTSAITGGQWVRVTRNGSSFTGAVSTDGVTWTTIGTATATIEIPTTAGPVVYSGATSNLTTARFTNVVVGPVNATPPPPAPTTTTLVTTGDSTVMDGGAAPGNFGSINTLTTRTYTTNNNRWSYLKFDLSTVTTISNALLRLVGKLTPSGSNIDVAVYGVQDTTWGETAITWNNKPPTAATALATRTITDTVTRTYDWDVTAYLQAEKAAGRNIVTLAIKSTTFSATYVQFNSRNAGSSRPSLVVTG